MVRHENIELKLDTLVRVRKKLDRYAAMPFSRIRGDDDLQGAVERYLFLAVQATIDVAEMLCKYKRYGRAESMSRAFELLREHGVLGDELASSLIRMVGFRNALVHGYDNLDYAIVEDILRNRLADLDDFVARVQRSL